MTPRTEGSGLAKPNTAAGRELLRFGELGTGNTLLQDILAIEAEASAEPRRLLAALVEFCEIEVPYWGDMPGQDERWEIYNSLLRAARRYLANDR